MCDSKTACVHRPPPRVGYQFVVAGRNIALGVFPSMAVAVQSIMAEDPAAYSECGWDESHQKYVSPKHGCTLTVTAVRSSATPTPLTRGA